MRDDEPTPTPVGKVSCPHCGEAHPVAWAHCPKTGRSLGTGKALVGRMIAGRYRVVGVLAEGGMGTVYVAEQAHLGRRIAIKRLHPELTQDEAAVKRFQREARAAAAIGHENIVEVIDMGFAEDGAPYLAMEYLRGETLASALHRESRLAPARACYVLGQVLSALEAVHVRGIIHRDLKPDNVFLTRRNGRADFVKVFDFGVSKMRATDGGDPVPLTRTGVMVGTPQYISPEQARGSRVHDHRVDVYAVGIMLYECLTGRRPFDGPNYNALLQAILKGEPEPIRAIVPQVPEGVELAATKAMSRLPNERFGSAFEMLRALLPYGALPPEGNESWDERFGVDSPDPEIGADPPPPPKTSSSASLPRRSLSSRPPRKPTSRPPLPITVESAMNVDAIAGLAIPLPQTFFPLPRRFEAHSADWMEGSSTASASPRVPSTIDRASGVQPEAPRVRGAFVGMALFQVREAFGVAGLDRLLSSMPDENASRLRGVLMTVPWVPADLLTDLGQSAEITFGDGSGAVPVQIGRGVATRALRAANKHFLRATIPTDLMERLPRIWSAFHGGGDVRVRSLANGRYEVDITGRVPATLSHAQIAMGFFAGLAELVGAKEIENEIVACTELESPKIVIGLNLR